MAEQKKDEEAIGLNPNQHVCCYEKERENEFNWFHGLFEQKQGLVGENLSGAHGKRFLAKGLEGVVALRVQQD